MKTISTILAAALACAAITPAYASPGDAKFYKASYDAQRGVYCIRTTPLGARTLVPTIMQKNCRTKAQWAKAGLTFSRAPLSVVQMAER